MQSLLRLVHTARKTICEWVSLLNTPRDFRCPGSDFQLSVNFFMASTFRRNYLFTSRDQLLSCRDSGSTIGLSNLRRRQTDFQDDDDRSLSGYTNITKDKNGFSSEEESDDSGTTFKSCRKSSRSPSTHRSTRSQRSRVRDSHKGTKRKRSCCGYVTCITKLLILMPLLTLLCLLTIGFLSREITHIKCRLEDLPHTLYPNIFGQELAIAKISKSLGEFCEDYIPGEPLVLVFWGQTGVGKTLTTTLLAEHFGTNSRVIPSELFKISEYRDWLGSKHPLGPHFYALDDVASTNEVLDLVECTQSLSLYSGPLILILTTSLDSHFLNDSFMEHCAKGDDSQDAFEYHHTPPALLESLRSLNPILVPFLPLTRTHVKLCIEKRLKRLKINRDDKHIEKIANELEYFHDRKRLFSKIGCKQLNDKIFRIVSP